MFYLLTYKFKYNSKNRVEGLYKSKAGLAGLIQFKELTGDILTGEVK